MRNFAPTLLARQFPLYLVLITTALSACSANEVNRLAVRKDRNNADVDTGGAVDCGSGLKLQENADGDPILPQPSANSGVIVFKLQQDSIDPCTVDGYIVGQKDDAKVKRVNGNTYVISDVPSGEHDIIVTGKKKGDGSVINPTDVTGTFLVGNRMNSVKSTARQTTAQDLFLFTVGQITGVAKLAGSSNHEGVEVYIPGTSYSSITDAAGTYRFNGDIPPGVHNLVFRKTGYSEGRIENVEVKSAQSYSAADIVLTPEAGEALLTLIGPEGAIIEEVRPTLTTRTVKFTMRPKGRPSLMKISEDNNFANKNFVPFQTTATYTFSIDALRENGMASKTLSIQLLAGETLSTIEYPLVLDLFSEIRGKNLLIVDNLTEDDPSLTLNIGIDPAPKDATFMQLSVLHADDLGSSTLSFNRDLPFVGRNWLPFSPKTSVDILKQGVHHVFIRFRNFDGAVSDTYSRTLSVELFPQNSVAFDLQTTTLDAAYDPIFPIINIKSPIKESEIFLSTNANLGDASVIPSTATTNFRIPGVFPCGGHTIYMAIRDKRSGQLSTIVSRPVHYECGQTFEHEEIVSNEATVLEGDRYVFTYGGLQYQPNVSSALRFVAIDRGMLYNLDSKSWQPVSSVNSPGRRLNPFAVWTGSEFLIWGGFGNYDARREEAIDPRVDGGLYNPQTNAWRPIPAAPFSNPVSHSMVQFTGSQLIVFGGKTDSSTFLSGGFVLDLATLTWRPMSQQNSPGFRLHGEPDTDRRINHRDSALSVWTGKKFIVWGGRACIDDCSTGTPAPVNTGAMYDLTSDSWTTMESVGAPTARDYHALHWTGSQMIVLGGEGSRNNLGAAFDPETDSNGSWHSYPSIGATLTRYDRSETQMLAFGQRAHTLEIAARGGQIYAFGGNYYADDNSFNASQYLSGLQLPLSADSINEILNLPPEGRPSRSPSRQFEVRHAGEHFGVWSMGALDGSDVGHRWVSLFDLTTKSWRTYPNQIQGSASTVVDVKRDLAETMMSPHRFYVFSGMRPSLADPQVKQADATGIAYATGLSPLEFTRWNVNGRSPLWVSLDEEVGIGMTIHNKQLRQPAFQLRIQSIEGPATIVDDDVTVDALAGNSITTISAANSLRIRISSDEGIARDTPIKVKLYYVLQDGNMRYETITLFVARSRLTASTSTINLVSGETIPVAIKLRNSGSDLLQQVNVTLAGNSCLEDLDPPSITINSMEPGAVIERTVNIRSSGANCAIGSAHDLTYEASYQSRAGIAANLSGTFTFNYPSPTIPFTVIYGDEATEMISPPLDIPDNDDVGVVHNMPIADSGTVTSITINISVTHAYKSDLRLTLISPNGTEVVVHNEESTLIGNYVLNTEFDDEPVQGTWKLRAADVVSADVGTLDAVTLTIHGNR